MIVYLNGRFVPEEHACVSIYDRGFLYGDGLFETIRLYGGAPFLWNEHMARLEHGCSAMRLRPPMTRAELRCVLSTLLHSNGLANAIARIALTRGTGQRGYSPRGADHPTLCVTLFEPANRPANYKVVTSSIRLPTHDSLASFKHSNKLRQVLARAEADDTGAEEALLLNDSGEVVEGTSTNLFWVEGDTLCTPPLEGILPGTTRAYILKRAAHFGISARETSIKLPELLSSNGVFVTSAALEVMQVSHINDHPLHTSPIVHRLREEYR